MTPPRSVLVLNHFARTPGAPGGTRHIELFSRLPGWDARLLASNRSLMGGQRIEATGILEPVWVTPHAGNGPARILNWASYAVTATFRGVRARQVDVVYASSPHLLAGLSGWVLARRHRTPLVLEIRDVWPQVLADMGAMSPTSPAFRLLERLERFLYRRSDRVVILAEGVRAHVAACGVDPDHIVFVPNGADASDFVPSTERDAARERYGFRGVTAVYTGAHGPANGLDLLLDAAAELATSHPQVQIALIGDGALKARLVERAASDRLENVLFLDPVPKSEIPDVLGAADIGVHCLADVDLFRSGVSPNKLFDYMAAGLPAVTNTPGEMTAFVEASEGGVAVPPDGLAAGIGRLAALSPEERQELGRRGQAHLESTQSRTAMAARLKALLDDVADAAGQLRERAPRRAAGRRAERDREQ